MTLTTIILIGYVVNLAYVMLISVISTTLLLYKLLVDPVEFHKNAYFIQADLRELRQIRFRLREKNKSNYISDDLWVIIPFSGALKLLIDVWYYASIGVMAYAQRLVQRKKSILKDRL